MPRRNLLIALLLFVSIIVNFFGVFAPELGFDALWYHLPISKIYLHSGHIFHIPGGLLYYSAMPRLAELMFIPLIKIFDDTGPHLLNFSAGIATCFLTYQIAQKYLNKDYSLIAMVIFYITPIVGWLSGSSYIDLIRTFWETLAILLILNKRFLLSGIVLGLAISTKTLSLGTIPIGLIFLYLNSKSLIQTLKVVLVAAAVGLPWYFLSFLNTGYPFYPIAAGLLDSRHSSWPQIVHPLSIVADYWKVFLSPEDLISPIFVIIIPFLLLKWRSLLTKHKSLIIYFVLSYLVWWLIPRLGGGRFLLPYLPIWSILTSIAISLQSNLNKKLLFFSIGLISILNIVIRTGTEFKLLKFYLGKETKAHYLCRNLNFNFGNFYDCDGFLKKTLKPTDLVLIKGVHNLAYINFPFVHESWYRGEKVSYILIQGDQKATGFKGKLIYTNNQTRIRLYKPT